MPQNKAILRKSLAVSLVLTCLINAPSFAQPSAGSLMQQLQSEQPLITLPPAQPSVAPGRSAPTAPDQQKVFIKKFKFLGNQKLSEQDLQTLVAPYKNTSLSFADIKGITELIGEHYRQKGWLARALVPAQDVTDGVLTIQVVEAVVGEIRIDNQSKRVSTERIESWIDNGIPRQSGLSLGQLDRTMLTLNDLPDVNAVSSLQSGTKEGETDLNIVVADNRVWTVLSTSIIMVILQREFGARLEASISTALLDLAIKQSRTGCTPKAYHLDAFLTPYLSVKMDCVWD